MYYYYIDNTTGTNQMYTIKSFKSFQGRQGYGFSLDLMLGKEKVAQVTDEANGGMIWFRWVKPEDAAPFFKAAQAALKASTNPEDDYARDHINDQERETLWSWYITRLVTDFEIDKKVKSLLKSNKIVMIEKGRVMMTKKLLTPITAGDIARFAAEYPKAVIVNGKPEAEARELLMKHL